jgi:hypothetical protein
MQLLCRGDLSLAQNVEICLNRIQEQFCVCGNVSAMQGKRQGNVDPGKQDLESS